VSCVVTKLAEAVVAALNGGQLSMPFTAQRLYQPTFTPEDLAILRVSVVPKSLEIALASRASAFHDYSIDIGIQKRLTQTDESAICDEIDTLLSFTEEIADALRGKRLAGYPEACWLSLKNEPVYAPEHLERLRVFTAVLTVTYRVNR
jgi:hypothetical protein